MVRGALMMTVVLLAACAAPLPFRAGEERLGPIGWFDYCVRHPDEPGCGWAAAAAQPQTAASGPAAGL
ncbi:hypothetical protein [Caldimonas tepidiphila]|uniref:hypothetical protein n=1 Tax=Caldimonas tepidiphila TaxID=2315841 RepID=UPI0013009323|nr:hypothetical protein [Caldimonas tepidiphila]